MCEIKAHSSFENGKRALALAHALRASQSGGSPWVEQTRHVLFIADFSITGIVPGSVCEKNAEILIFATPSEGPGSLNSGSFLRALYRPMITRCSPIALRFD